MFHGLINSLVLGFNVLICIYTRLGLCGLSRCCVDCWTLQFCQFFSTTICPAKDVIFYVFLNNTTIYLFPIIYTYLPLINTLQLFWSYVILWYMQIRFSYKWKYLFVWNIMWILCSTAKSPTWKLRDASLKFCFCL